MSLIRGRRFGAGLAVFTFLLIEFVDEFIFGIREAAWPLVRDDLGLTYAQIGLILALPNALSFVVDIFQGVLADMGHRRRLMLWGGAGFVLAALLTALAGSFGVLLLANVLFSPSSSAFVTLAQTALMDHDPRRHEQNMARWTFAGSLGVMLGSLAVAAAGALGGSWRMLFALSAVIAFGVWLIAWRVVPAQSITAEGDDRPENLIAGLREALAALRRPRILRWLVLLVMADLVLDKLLAYLALYFVDVVGVSEAEAGVAVAVFLGVGLVGDLLAIPLLERVPGQRYLRWSAWATLGLLPLLFLLPGFLPRLVVVALIGLCNSGWYSVLQAGLYGELPGRSGIASAVTSFTGPLDILTPLAIGFLADRFGLGVGLWLLLLGPLAVLALLPRRQPALPPSAS